MNTPDLLEQLLVYAKANPGTYIFPGWDGDKVARAIEYAAGVPPEKLSSDLPAVELPVVAQDYSRGIELSGQLRDCIKFNPEGPYTLSRWTLDQLAQFIEYVSKATPAPIVEPEYCTFPKCHCPMDPGPAPDWCARGLPHSSAPIVEPVQNLSMSMFSSKADYEIAAAIPVMREYALKNPIHHVGETPQDPNGVHAWLERNDAKAAITQGANK